MMRTGLFCLLFFSSFCRAQISGIVVDARSRKPIQEAEVFIDQRSVSARCDSEGKFLLRGIKPGFVDLIVFKRGYKLFKSSMRLDSGKAYSVNLTLEVNKLEGKENGSEQQKDLLRHKLLGKNFDRIHIINEQSLRFTETPEGWRVAAEEPLIIRVPEMGYEVRYYLVEGKYLNNKLQLSGYYAIVEAPATGSLELRTRQLERHTSYAGSFRHFMSSIMVSKGGSPFSLYDGSGKPKEIVPLRTSVKNYYTISFGDSVRVIYEDESHQKWESTLVPKGSIQVNAEGILLNPNNLEVRGAMNHGEAIQLPPMDYMDDSSPAADYHKYLEKIYVQTDKPYYYPGEPLWFKGYINFYQPSLRDSLSKVAYVEIIDRRKAVVLSRMVRIDSGLFNGDFILPDTLPKGDYILRAYTQLQRNYGEEFLFVMPLPVLAMNEKINLPQIELRGIEDNNLKVSFDKLEYSTGEQITMYLSVTDSSNIPIVANLSVSVTDIVQVAPIEVPYHFKLDYPIHISPDDNVKFQYPVEYGFGYQAKFRNERGKPEKASISIIQLDPPTARFVETDENGVFNEGGFLFFDSAKFSFKSDKATDAPYGKVEILPRSIPEINWPRTFTKIDLVSTDSPQRIISEYEVPKDSKLLETIEIKASRIPQEETSDPNYRVRRPYGKPDFVLTKKDLRLELGYGNLIYYLQGKVPGLGAGMNFTRASAQSINFSSGPLVMLNDVPLQGNAAEVLGTIDPNIVESVEFTKRVNVLYGSQGAFGVISVYTTKSEQRALKKDPNFQDITIYGFDRSRKFRYPEHNRSSKDNVFPDYRSLIYWNPNVTTSKTAGIAKLVFPASDLPGKYRVCVNGITQEGKPIETIAYLAIAAKD